MVAAPFFMLVLTVEYILIINYTLHYTIYSSSYMFLGDLLCAAFMYCIYTYVFLTIFLARGPVWSGQRAEKPTKYPTFLELSVNVGV